ncbi:V/A-type H+-transporting ATPase subunit I [Halobiforma haloterrestris]|uniref:A-type ATP synthase subunit I n=1 Tax=Natronobacterium haloterrestre TaxID=148448 RepID=A0A1I1E3D3_NATHA|nr:V-type ATP synthase subunit I [Halobiforma haloterrestris]SFB79728.1 V/A-type H+-transporting ATPase subunit I [Halobiforma haloterrestris]
MLRPEKMSKVSVTGSKGVMPTVIETVHDLNLVHLSDYDGSWEGFDNGSPIEGADDASEKLVTVRALESTLDLDEDTKTAGQQAAEVVAPVPDLDEDTSATPLGQVDDDWEAHLEEVRTRVNELDDQRSDVEAELRDVTDRIDRIAPFAELGIDLDLLSGYDSVDVVVGEGSVDEIDDALEASDDVRAFETFTGGDVVAIVAAPTDDADPDFVGDAIVGVDFTRHEVPDTDQSPDAYVSDLESRKRELESEIESIDAELDEIAAAHGEFLQTLEGRLSIEVQRAEAPLQFATSERAFIAEGWLPRSEYDRLVSALRETVGDSVEIEELEQADYDEYEHGAEAHTGSGDGEGGEETEAETGPTAEPDEDEEPVERKAATDGGVRADGHGSGAVTMDDEPPVILDNITPAKPFELLVKMVAQPKYSELDPTVLVFLTYPFAFGYMIGDIGYGLLYMLMGYGAWKAFDSDAGKAVGTIGLWAGGFTVLFGWLYDEMFGVHIEYWMPEGIHSVLSTYLFMDTLDKGLQSTEWAMLWIVFSLVFGLIHLNIGLILGFINELSHGLKAAVYERLSWILTMNGLFVWIFSGHAVSQKPDFVANYAVVPEAVGLAAIVAFFVGAVMVGIGEGISGVFEIPAWAFGHVLSYLRLVAVLLAKAGMAFAVNLLVFGGYTDHGYTVFNLPTYDVTGYEQDFVGLIWMDPMWIGIPLAILVFVFGHVLVLLLGITAAGIQMLRLEYVEFFQKFYEGGGEEYDPFGHEETDTQPAD